jgi:hypothetical protein
MIRESASDLPKLGERAYVQGGTIFNGIVAACDAAFGADWLAGARISSFKLEREAVANGRILVADEPIAGVDLNATFLAESAGRQIRGGFVDEGADFRREPYDEESFNRPLDIGTGLRGTFALPGGRPREDFIKGVVGANKLLHQQSTQFGAPLTRVQFLYLKGLAGACLVPTDADTTLRISNLSVKETTDEVWTINRVDVEREAFRSEFRICYRSRKAA